ncbi:unnamed protein product [Adineta steineri]|uniref:Uncharacterized protein n=1 Tax=Adineta steineri TaxID=433720 RepID=A0A814EEN0_9BILA|nr:unnamed protein product [Adineta steineri]
MSQSNKDATPELAKDYISKRKIPQLFEALMTGLMVNKPEDHIDFLIESLSRAENHPDRISGDLFITKSSCSLLPPIHSKSNESSSLDPQSVLPRIEHTKTNSSHKPLIFILSSSNSLKLCSRLLERYHQINYVAINDESKYRYDTIQHEIEQYYSQSNGFLITGDIDEQNFLRQWQDKLGRINLFFIISSNINHKISNQNSKIIQIDSTKNFNDILASIIHYLDKLFLQDTFFNQRFSTMSTGVDHFNLPIFFCIDNHRIATKTNDEEDLSFDNEFEMADEENNNSFIYTLCQHLVEQFSFKYISYRDLNKDFSNYEQLKKEIIESRDTCSGYIIDYFPTSLNDLRRFYSEIGPCSALIYIGDYRTGIESTEVDTIIQKFEQNKKALHVDCRMEVDEIYEDFKSEILKYI